MRPTTALAIALLLAASGCLDGKPARHNGGLDEAPTVVPSPLGPADEPTSSPTPVDSPPSTVEPTTEPRADRPPNGTLHVFALGSPVPVRNGSYVAMANATLFLDARSSLDPDGDPLHYRWFVDRGEVFVDEPTLSLALAEGSHAVELRVRAHDLEAVVIARFEIAPEPDPYAGFPDPLRIHVVNGSFEAGTGGNAVHAFEVEAGMAELDARLTWNVAEEALGPTGLHDLDLAVRDPEGRLVANATSGDFEFVRLVPDATNGTGTWTFNVSRLKASERLEYTLEFFSWSRAPIARILTGVLAGGEVSGIPKDPPEPTITPTPQPPPPPDVRVEPGRKRFEFDTPFWLSGVVAHLAWTTPDTPTAACDPPTRVAADLDLMAAVHGQPLIEARSTERCEFGFWDAPRGRPLEMGAASMEVLLTSARETAAEFTLTLVYA